MLRHLTCHTVQGGEWCQRPWFRDPKEEAILVLRLEGEKMRGGPGKASEEQGHVLGTRRGVQKVRGRREGWAV